MNNKALSTVDSSRIGLKSATAGDRKLCQRLFIETHQQPLILAGLNEQHCSTLLQLQFESREAALLTDNPDARHDIVQVDGETIGRLMVNRERKNMHLLDIALLSVWRGRGIGSYLLNTLCQEADTNRCDITLQVAVDNPALNLYRRFGFTPVSDDGVYQGMKRHSRVLSPTTKKPSSDQNVK